jgi:hypothetical protein
MMRDYTTSASRTGPRKGPRKRRAEGIQTSASQNSSVRTGRIERNRTRDCAMPSRTFPHCRARDRHIACRCSVAMKAEQQGAERRLSKQRTPAQWCAPDYRRIKAVAGTGKAPVGIRCLGAGKSLAGQERRSACATSTPRVSHCGAPKEFALALIHGTPWSCGARVLVTAILPLAPYTL